MNLVINSQFRPFTYDEMVKPLAQYKEVYDKVEQDYSDLVAQTEVWKNIAEREKNPIAYEMYNKYSNDLAAITEDFSKGMNLSNRRALLGMKRRYYEDIEPIAKASKKIEELSSEQRKLAASNPNLMFDRDFSSEVSVDQMIENPNLSYRAIDGNDIYTKGAAISKAMSSRINNINPALHGQYWEIRKGFGEEAANKFLLDSGAIPELNKALEDLVSTSDAPDKLKGRLFEYAKQGALSGMVGDTSYQTNRGYESPADAAKRRDAHELFEVQMGIKPYMEDDEGNSYYTNSVANTSWKVDNKGKTEIIEDTEKGGKTNSIKAIEKRVVPDLTIGNGVLRDPISGKYYKYDSNGNFSIWTKEDQAVANKNSIVRINSYLSNRKNSPKPNEVMLFTVDGSENLVKQDRTKKAGEYERMYNEIDNGNVTVESISNYINSNPNSDNAKKIKAELVGTLLEMEDLEVVSFKPGWGRDERILIRVKNNNTPSATRDNTHS